MGIDELEWVASVGCTGGPVMVVDFDGFAQWTGTTPFTALRARSEADAKRFSNRRNVLHFWGNLGGAGERFVECDDEAGAIARLEGLHEMAKANCAGVVITQESDVVTHFRDPASGGELRAELIPKSEYDASWETHPDDDAWEHTFGDDVSSLFWFVGDELVHVGCNAARDAIILLKHTVEKFETTAKDHAAACAHVGKQKIGKSVAEITLSTPRAVVIWAPIAPDNLEGFDRVAIANAADGNSQSLSIEGIEGIGTVICVKPGRYSASIGSVDAKGKKQPWSAKWCRLTRVAD